MSLLLLLAPKVPVADRYFQIMLALTYQPVSPVLDTGALIAIQQTSTLLLGNGSTSCTVSEAPT